MTNIRRSAVNSVSTFLDRCSPERLFLLPFRLDNAHPPVFIVGTPRSGTTIVYLHLVNRFHFSYFSNLSKKFSMFAIPSALVGRTFFRYAPTQENRFGVTGGAMGPSDGWRIFHRWFPRNGTQEEGKSRGLHELKNIVRMHEVIFDAPFINKNNANSVRIHALAELFPDALFVHVHRRPLDTVLSLLDARRKQNIGVNEWWGPAPSELLDCRFDTEESQVVQQVIGLERIIADSFSDLSDSRRISISYEDFCRDPGSLCKRVSDYYEQHGYAIKSRSGTVPDKYEISSKVSRYDDAVLERIEQELEAVGGSIPQ